MNQDHWRRLRDLVEEALEADAPQRAAFLDRAAAGDADLRADAERIIAARTSGSVLEPPLQDAAGIVVSAFAAAELLGRRFGPYRAVGLLGEGAMGTVYLAVRADDSFDKRVAVKVLRRGLVGTDARRRFEQERRLLARLDHPAICGLLDGGTTEDGLAYIVMEYVQGVPLSAWVRERPADRTTRHADAAGWRRERRVRLELFARICGAVAYAHSCGVVHRDLKPANILVVDPPTGSSAGPTGEHVNGVALQAGGSRAQAAAQHVKIIDFGIARVLDADAPSRTTTNSRLVGTLPYMAPEQVCGDSGAVDARTDIYALGVILYELLAGRQPLDVDRLPLPDAARLIRDDEPTRLGLLDRSLRGDLETIVAKAMEKDPARRYQSAADLEADILRFLRDEPIVARPPSAVYQMSKFVRRHRTLVGATLTALLILCASVVAVSAALVRSREQGRRAQAVSAFMESVLASVDPFRPPQSAGPGPTYTGDDGGLQVADVLDAAVARLDRAPIGDQRTEAQIRRSLGASYSGLGRHEPAVAQLRAAYDIQRRQLGERDPETLECQIDLATALTRSGQLQESGPLHRRTVAACTEVFGPADPRTLRARFELTMDLLHGDHYQEAATSAGEIVSFCKATRQGHTPVAALAAGVQAVALMFTEHSAEGEALAADALARIHETCGDDHYIAALVQCSLGGSAAARGDLPEAERWLRSAAVCYRKLLGDRDPRTAARLRTLGAVLNQQGRYTEAESPLRRAAAVASVGSPLAVEIATLARHNLADSLRGQGKLAEAAAIEPAPTGPSAAAR